MSLLFDKAQALAHLGGNELLLAEVAQIFLEDCPKMRDDLSQAIAAGDAVGLCRAAHTIKGSVDLFSATAARTAALKLEEIGRDEQLDEAATSAKVLNRELDRLIPELESLAAQA